VLQSQRPLLVRAFHSLNILIPLKIVTYKSFLFETFLCIALALESLNKCRNALVNLRDAVLRVRVGSK
jgi:hypothetical protein